jgi:hypothetical protein
MQTGPVIRPRGDRRARKSIAARPNILIIVGDDIGWFNVSACNRGMMGYETPHIDRIARERYPVHGPLRTAELHARCAALMTGQTPLRTGLTKVGIPGAKRGISDEDLTIAEILRPLGTRKRMETRRPGAPGRAEAGGSGPSGERWSTWSIPTSAARAATRSRPASWRRRGAWSSPTRSTSAAACSTSRSDREVATSHDADALASGEVETTP